MKSDPDGFSDENDPDCFADESNGNSGDNPFDYSIDEITTQERIVSPSLTPKLLALTDKSSLDPQRSEGAATLSKTTTTAVKPSTDLQGALSSLQPQRWLSSTAIELVLSLCPSKSFRVFDPLAYDVGQPEIKNFKPTPNNVQYVLLPLYYREHWTLSFFDLENHTITCYDSLRGHSTIAHRDALLEFANNFKIETPQWTFQHGNQAKQDNFYDCGIFVLVTSLHIFADSICPPSYDCSLWRTLFRALLTVKCQTELPAMKWKISPSTRVEDEDSM